MAELKLKDFVDENDLQKLVELDNTIERVRADYANAAKELAKGLKLNVEGVADLEKLGNLYNTQAKTAGSASAELTEALRKQSEITQAVSKKIEEKLNVEKLSAAELKKLTKASEDNAASLEKAAKAEANLTKAQNTGNATRKKAVLSEEERLKIIRSAISLTNQEVHSRSQAKEMNKQLQKAVDVLKDTDENYIRTLARLNSTIGINTDYIKRNSDRYSQQKMTIGAYREEVKAAWIEIQNGNKSMQNMGIIARNAGKILNSEFAPGLSKVSAGLKGWAAGYIGAQAVVSGVVALFTKLREGVGSVVEFEFANSRLAAILGTTSDQIKELTLDAKRLGATTKYTASEATELQIELAKLGFTRKEILDATESVLRFAQATGAELGEAASLTGAALRMFNADTRETERYVSAMAVATTKSALSFSYLATALPIVGPVAKAFNFSIEDTLALLGKLSDAGFDASMSATATRNILLNLADTNGVLAKSLGGPVKTLPELVAGLQKLKEQGVDLNSTLEMTDKRSVAAFNAFLTAADKIVPLRDQITGVEGELGDMAHTMEDNAKGAIDSLKSAWEALMISLGKNTGVLSGIINEFTELVRSMRAVIATAEELGEERLANAARNGQEAAKQDKEWVKSKEESIDRVALKYRKEGVDGAEAFEKARAEQLKVLERSLSQEEARLQLYTKRNQKQWDEYNNRSFLKQGLGLQKSTNAMKKDIDESFSLVEQQTAYISSLKEKMEQIRGIANDYKEENTESTFNKPLTDKEKRELEKAAKEKQKIKETYQESELALMDEGLEKELAKIGIAYSKKIAAVKGYSKEEIATRQNLAKEMQDKLDEFTIKYNSDREKKDVENALSVVKKGSQEELDLKLHQFELQREAEIDAAEKTGEDVFLIDEKYAKKKQELYEKHASDQVQLIAENAAHEQEIRDGEYVMDMLALKKQLASKEITQQEYAELEYQLKLDYVRKTTEAAIDALELELQNENLSAEDRAKIAEQLQKLKANLSQQEAEAEIDAINKVTKADEKAQKERQKNLKKWLQTASQAVGAIGDLVSTIYDGQIQKIEEEQEANDEKYDKDVERIQNLADSGAISEEEAEARKRAAKERTEAKNAELEKQKQEMARKQAIWDKATSIAQAGIATALAITEALPNIPLSIVIGALGAIQVATILATPIPSYAEGTKGNDRHPGGKALVGDAGKHEVVMYSGKAWITPDTPTLMDIPKGAQVFPDVDTVDLSGWDLPEWNLPTFSPAYFTSSSGDTVIFNDYSRLEKRVDKTNILLMRSLKMQRQDASNREFELYKLSKLK
ncbi:phage tail tape measure protein [Bacteroides ovatus]|uniref:phage tail tape measure protein n=1 Tax=Bacteroides ovatus TaxID=28116 RepID=UPI00189C4909|nr:phage tail tape measure protein [Bacteroides ovatus]MDC2623363.1 phage tail tape measure protein [Bacteroides ovatus]MDC2637104.1 phage tail tape measure protein [Bacteroides ovatus]MDC2652959.1 phage tail tape measure protein [Bacteroides ovatus]DAP82433.1 MAG TPA: minor tail protein [Caudoviricetes sp.]